MGQIPRQSGMHYTWCLVRRSNEAGHWGTARQRMRLALKYSVYTTNKKSTCLIEREVKIKRHLHHGHLFVKLDVD